MNDVVKHEQAGTPSIPRSTGARMQPATAILAALGVALFLLSLVVVLPQYGRLDDYTQLIEVQNSGVREFVGQSLTFGRPVTFAVNGFLYRIADSVDGLWLLRLVATICFAIGAVLFGSMCRRGTKDFWIPAAFTLLVFTLPGTWVFITWAQGAGHGFTFMVAVGSVFAATRAQSTRGASAPTLWLIAILLALVAMFGYQPFGLAIPGMAIACAVVAGRRGVASIGLKMLVIAGTAFVLNVLVVKSLSTAALAARTELASDWGAKLSWIVGEFLPRVAWPFSLTASTFLAWLVALTALAVAVHVGVTTRHGRSFGNWAGRAVIVVAALLAPMVPFLVISENWASSRGVLAPALTFWSIFLAFTIRYVVYPARTRESGAENNARAGAVSAAVTVLLPTMFGVAAVVGVLFAWFSLAQPSSQEWAQAKTIWSGAPKTITQAEVWRQSFYTSKIPLLAYDEHGILSGGSPFVAPSLQSLAAREGRGIRIAPSAIVLSKVDGKCNSGPLLEIDERGTVIRINPTRPWQC